MSCFYILKEVQVKIEVLLEIFLEEVEIMFVKMR